MKKRIRAFIKKQSQRLDRPFPALPVDIFRVGAGVLSAAYFWHLRHEVDDISAPDGVIDHQLVRKLFPYTKLGFFHPRMGKRFFKAVYGIGVVSSLSMVVGVGIRPNATFLYLTAVSTYRWNFIAMYVDDAIMHLTLFWLMLLPSGRTLTLKQPLSPDWKTATVPGFTVRAFLANLSLIYLVAGLWKWNSPIWKRGDAVYTALKMPISRAPRRWSHRLAPALIAPSYFSMLLEPMLSGLPLLPTNSRLKAALGTGMFAFHVGIIGTLRIPYANIACIAALPLLFSDELMHRIAPSNPANQPTSEATPQPHKRIATTVVTLLTLANIWRIRERHTAPPKYSTIFTRLRKLLSSYADLNHQHNPWQIALWAMGIAQSYRLFDWIDDRDWHIYYEGVEWVDGAAQPFETTRLFPHTTRHILLNSYIHNQSWIVPPAADLAALQRTLLTRYVDRFARQNANTGDITITSVKAQITPDNFDLHKQERTKLLTFTVQNGVPTITHMHLSAKA